jgi:hypothetical protein
MKKLILMIFIKLNSQVVNYKVPSHKWKNHIQPWLDLYLIMGHNELRIETSSTGVAYADFNGDEYLEILTLAQAPDGEFPEHNIYHNYAATTFSMDIAL